MVFTKSIFFVSTIFIKYFNCYRMTYMHWISFDILIYNISVHQYYYAMYATRDLNLYQYSGNLLNDRLTTDQNLNFIVSFFTSDSSICICVLKRLFILSVGTSFLQCITFKRNKQPIENINILICHSHTKLCT